AGQDGLTLAEFAHRQLQAQDLARLKGMIRDQVGPAERDVAHSHQYPLRLGRLGRLHVRFEVGLIADPEPAVFGDRGAAAAFTAGPLLADPAPPERKGPLEHGTLATG